MNMTGHVNCPQCGGSATSARTTTWTVQLTCRRCGHWWKASDRESDVLIRSLGIRCPGCKQGMVIYRSRSDGIHLACVSEVCGGRRGVAAIDAAARGEPLPSFVWFEPVSPSTVARRTCSECFLAKPRNLFPGGPVCVDCLSDLT
jgi:hypothetical protein